MVERGKNGLFYSVLLYIDRKKNLSSTGTGIRLVNLHKLSENDIHWSARTLTNDVNVSYFELFDVIMTFQHTN